MSCTSSSFCMVACNKSTCWLVLLNCSCIWAELGSLERALPDLGLSTVSRSNCYNLLKTCIMSPLAPSNAILPWHAIYFRCLRVSDRKDRLVHDAECFLAAVMALLSIVVWSCIATLQCFITHIHDINTALPINSAFCRHRLHGECSA